MSEREQDLRLERELRGLLGERDPGPAPYGLRGRVDRIPEEHPSRRRVTPRRALPYLAAAAVIGVLVVGIAGIGRLPGGPGAGPAVGPATDPGAGESVTVPVFDPLATGVGIADPVSTKVLVLLVVTSSAALGFVALGSRGRRRLLVAALAVAVPVCALGLATQNHPEAGSVGDSGPGTADANDVVGPGAAVIVTVEPGEPFWFAFSVRNPGPLPMQLEGVVERLDPEAMAVPAHVAAWSDASATPGDVGRPGAPLTPTTIAPGGEVTVWLVDRAGACTQGATLEAGERLTGSTTARSMVTVRTSVLGWPRQSEVPLAFDVIQRYVQPCDPATP